MNSDRRYEGINPQQFKLLPLHWLFWDHLQSVQLQPAQASLTQGRITGPANFEKR